VTEPSAENPSPAGTFARLGPEFLSNPYAAYEMLRAAGPVVWMPELFGVGGWIVTGHAACSSALRNKQFGKEGHRVVPPEKLALIPQESVEVAERRRSNMLFCDPPDHTRLRGLVSQAFTPRTVERLRPRVAAVADQLIDAIAPAGHADLIRDFAFPLPIIVIAELLGVPPEDRDQFKAWSTVLTRGISPVVTREELVAIGGIIDTLNDYLRLVIEDRRKTPRADLISDLVRAQDAGDRLTLDEMLATCRLILAAGHETTVNLIGNGMVALLRDPGQRALLADPALLPGAVEELLRYDSPVQMTSRFAFDDAPIGDHTAKRGDLVVLLLGAANRDPVQFEDPARLDVRRGNAGTHLSLGSGIHYCLGAPLARLEGEIAVGALLRRLPALALGTEPLAWRPHPVLRGLTALPVHF
jgi:pimeloyl-[acyl-carrier protein] synthase